MQGNSKPAAVDREHVTLPGERVERSGPWLPYVLGFLGAYVNIMCYGFRYGLGNHGFELPLVNLLRNPSLYPNDPIREGLLRLPTLFWPVVAQMSRWFTTEQVLLIFFVITKAVLFVGMARLVIRMVKDYRLAACIILAIAFSPFLNSLTPFGLSDVLDSIQTHTSLAIAMIVWVGVYLTEGRWLGAVLICGLTTYVSALAAAHTLFAFLFFAILDWRLRRPQILTGALLGVVINIPAIALWHDRLSGAVPKDFVQALLRLAPGHLRLRNHSPHELIFGAGLLAAAGLMVFIAKEAGLRREFRFEMLALSYLIPVALGGFFGEFLLTPRLARLQLLRADSFLILYASLLIQAYGANLLLVEEGLSTGAPFVLGSLSILGPLLAGSRLLWSLFLAMLFWADPRAHFEVVWQQAVRTLRRSPTAGVVLLLCLSVAGGLALSWHRAWPLIPALVGAYVFLYAGGLPTVSRRVSKLAISLCCVAVALAAVRGAHQVPRHPHAWNPIIEQKGAMADWFALQRWAKDHTPTDAQFLVPALPGGFREFSERASWGEWRDGAVVYWFPAFADLYRERMVALGPSWNSPNNYEHQTWEGLSAVARANHLDYIIQSRNVRYAVSPVFANGSYAVYKVPQ